ncbi:response regulator transcription factor, partial [Chloroflexales bacterium ZM16-3]|nr:response regulator transcription factor [Chloroflexales bacterium ZM16-3]
AREVLRYPCSYEEARNITRGRIHKLRQKIERTQCTPPLIHSIRGTGYRLVEDDELEGA